MNNSDEILPPAEDIIKGDIPFDAPTVLPHMQHHDQVKEINIEEDLID